MPIPTYGPWPYAENGRKPIAGPRHSSPLENGLAKAKSAAQHALEIDPNLGEAYNALAWVKYVL